MKKVKREADVYVITNEDTLLINVNRKSQTLYIDTEHTSKMFSL